MVPRWLSWIDENIENTLIVVLYAYFCAIIFVEVVLRYGFGVSTGWGEMTARFAFVFVASLAVAQGARSRNHIRIDLFPSRLSSRGRLILYLYFDVLQFVLGTLVVIYAIKAMHNQWGTGHLMESLDLNLAIAYVALPLGWGLFLLRLVRRTVHDIGTYRKKGVVELSGGGFST